VADGAKGFVTFGSAAADSSPFRGWLIGHFIPAELGLRSTEDVEVKWGVHQHGEARPAWGTNAATTLSVLVSGCIRIEFLDGRTVVLERPGDYALWSPGLAHRWYIDRGETVVLTVRWPSQAPTP
jgi:hypothetical protein